MGKVFANGREVSGKAQANKSIAAFPSVCLSPPSPPAGPVPIPYPVTASASDTQQGTGSVKIKGKEVGKKNGSVYSKCNGNQPATRSFGMDVVSHVIEGKTKFAAYSFDVFFEKGNAERFMDLTTSNHSNTGTAITTSVAGGGMGGPQPDPDCEVLGASNEASRDEQKESKKGCGTVASGQFTPPGGDPIYYRGRSTKSHVTPSLYRNGYAQGLWPDRKVDANNKIPSQLNDFPDCGKRHYGNNAQGAVNHAEGKILEDVLSDIKSMGGGGNPLGSLKLKIDWPDHEPLPCPKCKKTLEAACKCFKIELCKEDNSSEDFCANPRSG